MGFIIAGGGIALVWFMQLIGVGSAYAYLLPGTILWFGMLKTGAHPTLAGVVLGLMTPVMSTRSREAPLDRARRAIQEFNDPHNNDDLISPVKTLGLAQRDLLPPVVRVQQLLHPWVAYGIMPLFALANAGVALGGIDHANNQTLTVMLGITLALVVGKPIGILLVSWVCVCLNWCRLPDGMNWPWLWLIGCLAGIGFTMSIFIANLAFNDVVLLNAAKLGVLLASLVAGVMGLLIGKVLVSRARVKTR